MDSSTHQTALVNLKMEKCNGTLTWSLPNTLSDQKTKHISAGLRLKYMTRCKENITYLDEGFIDMVSLKTVELEPVDMLAVPKQALAEISSCFQVKSACFIIELNIQLQGNQAQLTLTFGASLAQNPQEVFICSPLIGQMWAGLLADIKLQMGADCSKLRWLKEQYLYLHYLDEACRGPLAADAIQVFGGRSWAPTGESREAGAGKGAARKSGLCGVRTRKKMSYGNISNIHPLNKRGLHEMSETLALSSPVSSPAAQRRSLAVPPSFMLSSLMTRSV